MHYEIHGQAIAFKHHEGAAIWFLVSLLLAVLACRVVILLVWELSGELRPPPIRFMWAVPFILSIVVIITNLETAQVNIFIFTLVLLGLYQFSQQKDAWAGLLVGTATAIMAFSLPFFGSLLLSIALARGILLEKKRTLKTSKVL